MTEETKNALKLVLEMLRVTCVEQGVSIALQDDTINFIDTDTYLEKHEYKGIKVKISELVK